MVRFIGISYVLDEIGQKITNNARLSMKLSFLTEYAETLDQIDNAYQDLKEMGKEAFIKEYGEFYSSF